jgi:hypothetical protein
MFARRTRERLLALLYVGLPDLERREREANKPRRVALLLAGAVGIAALAWAFDKARSAEVEPDSDSSPVGLASLSSPNWPFVRVADRVRLPLGPRDDRLLVSVARERPPQGRLRALAYHYDTRIFDRPSRHPRPIGIVRRSTQLYADSRVRGKGCKKGAWYRLTTGGFACTRDGFIVSDEVPEATTRQPPPKVSATLPFRYAKMAQGSLRFHRPPTQEEQTQLAALRERAKAEEEPEWPEVVSHEMNGIFLVAIDREEQAGAMSLYRTIRGRYVQKADAELKPEPAMYGQLLDEHWKLPLAFVYGEEPTTIYGRRGHARGKADKHARYPVVGTRKRNGTSLVVGPAGLALPSERVRIARTTARPREIPAGARWIHVDVGEQTLVAYEGDAPVFATLVSSGLEDGFATPTGVFRVEQKFLSTTMSGPDPDAGFYEVAEVPWTQFYSDSYALHGAYWHDEFGRQRSHGCTNLSPVDARWLFYWTTPSLPPGWHGIRRAQGTWVVITRSAAS